MAPGRIEVALPDGRPVQVVMTPDEWSEMWGVMWGNVPDAVADVQRTLRSMRPEHGFAVYGQYELEPSVRDALLEREEFHPEPGGRWFTLDRDGKPSYFDEWTDPDEPLTS